MGHRQNDGLDKKRDTKFYLSASEGRQMEGGGGGRKEIISETYVAHTPLQWMYVVVVNNNTFLRLYMRFVVVVVVIWQYSCSNTNTQITFNRRKYMLFKRIQIHCMPTIQVTNEIA